MLLLPTTRVVVFPTATAVVAVLVAQVALAVHLELPQAPSSHPPELLQLKEIERKVLGKICKSSLRILVEKRCKELDGEKVGYQFRA